MSSATSPISGGAPAAATAAAAASLRIAAASGPTGAAAASSLTLPDSRTSMEKQSSLSGGHQLRTTRATARADQAGAGIDTPLFYSILVHNLSHSDLMLGLKAPPEHAHTPTPPPAAATSPATSAKGVPSVPATSTSSVQPPLPVSLIARPKFSRFKQITGRLLTYVENQGMVMQNIDFPSPMAAKLQRVQSATIPYGFRVKDGQMKFQDWEAFKLKGDGLPAHVERMPKPEVIAAYFPMLAVLIPRWLSIVAGKNARRGIRHADQNKKVLFLISGAGTPWNTEHDASGNSTKGVAKLATWFLNQFYPEIEVHTIHSGVEIFHYDANVSFVNTALKPRIEEVRHILAERYFDKWPRYMHLATTLTDGASARISAINASLRHLKPDMLHMWQLKSFWHEYPFVTGARGEADVEFHEHDKIEMTPPTLVSETDAWTKMLVKEMIAHKDEFERVRDTKEKYNELDTFWLRKSKQPVLSVLMVKKKNKGFKFFRGINVEVSMPTGSLCSERNAIGSALSSDPSLCRKDLRMIAVLALGLEQNATTSTLSAQMPIPSALIPLGHTPTSVGGSSIGQYASASPIKVAACTTAGCPNASASPSRPPMSPRKDGYHQYQQYQLAAAASAAHNDDSFGHDDHQPDQATAMDESGSDALPPHSTTRTGVARTPSERSSTGHRKDSSSPATKSRHLGLPTSPRGPAATAGVKPEDEPMSTSASATPRKRKASHSGAANRSPSPAAGAAAPAPPSVNSPMLLSPRLTRAGSMRETSPMTHNNVQLHSPRAIGRDLSNSAMGGFALGVAAVDAGESAAGSAATTPLRDDLASRKRVKRTHSQSHPTTAATAAADGHSLPLHASPEPGFGISHLHGVAAQDAYLRHELDLVRHRESLMLPPSFTAQLSGNTAPNAVVPMDRTQSEAGAHGQPVVTDERNPINPCGSCNEWLKKVAEVNPDFKVVTFTSTDCSTCFVKAVKF